MSLPQRKFMIKHEPCKYIVPFSTFPIILQATHSILYQIGRWGKMKTSSVPPNPSNQNLHTMQLSPCSYIQSIRAWFINWKNTVRMHLGLLFFILSASTKARFFIFLHKVRHSMIVTGFLQLEDWGRHQVWWNFVKPQAWQQCLISPCPGVKCSPHTLCSPPMHIFSATYTAHEHIQLPGIMTYNWQCVKHEVWSPARWNKCSWTVNTWLHVHMITSKQTCSKYLFFFLHSVLHRTSN